MGPAKQDGGADPYTDLFGRYDARRKDYLFRLTTDEQTFQSDPEKNGVALRRGFLNGQGPRPVCSLADQDAAAVASDNDHHLIVWTDSPCLKAGIAEPWDGEDLRTAIARLWTIKDPTAFQKSLVIPDEPPDEHGQVPGFRGLLRLLRQLTVCGRGDVRGRIRSLLAGAYDFDAFAPDYNPFSVFDGALIERVVEALHVDEVPDPQDAATRDDLAYRLTSRKLEGDERHISFEEAQKLIHGISGLLPSTVTIDLVNAAVDKGRPGPYSAPANYNQWEPAPDTREPPPGFGGREDPGTFGARESPEAFGARETPAGGYESPNPRPRKPRPPDMLFRSVWDALQVLAWFGRLGTESFYNVRSAVLAMTTWLRTGQVVDGQPKDTGARSLIQELFQNELWVPPHSDRSGYEDFEWPPYTREGIYWWRAVLKSHCIEHCYALKETADFHSTDLIRLLRLFPEPDVRIPGYVRNAVKLALLWFKYWWDEPPAKDSKGGDIAEMTMWSENHQILFAQSQLLAGALYRNLEFARSSFVDTGKARTGQDHIKEGLTRAERWLDFRLKFGFSEWNAPGYYNEDFPPLFNLVDFCNPEDPDVQNPDERTALRRLRIKAAMVLDLMVFDCARFTCRGSFGATAGRAYWESKCYGWEQSIGNTIEILFGTRGDYLDTEPSAVALATSAYDVPQVLLAIGLDRVVLDQAQPFTDRTRVSIDFNDAKAYNIGFDSEDDILFWWGLEGYYTDRTLEGTKRIVKAHDNLRLCGPFEPLYSIANLGWMLYALIELASIALDALEVGAGVLLAETIPFPLNVVVVSLEAENIIDAISDFFKDIWDYAKLISRSGPWKGAAEGAVGGALVAGPPGAVVGGIAGFFGGLFGDDDDDKPRIPDTALQALLEKLLMAFNTGTVLSTANIVTYNNGDAMLSSAQNHLPGLVSFQKQPWMANLGCEACVWTTARFMAPDVGSYLSAWGRLFEDIGLLRFHAAVGELVKTPVIQGLGKGGDLIGHDGPNYWTGSLALPMIVQHENAAIIAYNLPPLQRSVSGFSTHAWFPKQMFDDTRKQDGSGGTWFFGRKDHIDNGVKAGSGYVALFSAIEGDWTNEEGNAWNDKEIKTKPPGLNVLRGSNIWICVVGNEAQFRDVQQGKEFDTFCDEIQSAYLHVSGVGSPYGLECSFDVPRAKSPAGRSPRLELFYDDAVGKFAGDEMRLGDFPRFENRYVRQMVATGPVGSGVQPQVEGFTSSNGVAFGSLSYSIQHPSTGLTLDHDITGPTRRHNAQDEVKKSAATRRLQTGSLAAVRRAGTKPRRVHPLQHPKLDVSSIRKRTP